MENVDVANEKAGISLGQTLLLKHRVFRRINITEVPAGEFSATKDSVYAVRLVTVV